ncbi:MAG: hypothetical protein ACXVCY_05980 [Pseudobdellovibrionaceae bacterium]
MKKVKSSNPTKTARKASTTRSKIKSKLITKSKVPVTPIHDTSGGEMPNPTARHKPSRKDVRFGFR